MNIIEHPPIERAIELGREFATVAIKGLSAMRVEFALHSLKERMDSFMRGSHDPRYVNPKCFPTSGLSGIVSCFLVSLYGPYEYQYLNNPQIQILYTGPEYIFNQLTTLTEREDQLKILTIEELNVKEKRIKLRDFTSSCLFQVPQSPNSFFCFEYDLKNRGNLNVVLLSLKYKKVKGFYELCLTEEEPINMPRHKAFRYLQFFDSVFTLERIRKIEEEEFTTFDVFELTEAIRKYNEEVKNTFQYKVCKLFLAAFRKKVRKSLSMANKHE